MKRLGRQGPAPRGGRRHRRLRRALRRHRAQGLRPAAARDARPTASAPRSPSPRRWTCTTRSASTWSAMVVDDLVVCGAEPLFLTDYIATGKVVPERIAAIVTGIAEGCAPAGCALVGGETAEHPGLLAPDEYDVAGADHRRGRGRPSCSARTGSGPATSWSRWPRAGCTPTATRSSATCCSTGPGWRARPARRRARPHPRRGAARADPHLRQGLPRAGRATPRPTRCRHITGGGLAANLARVLPAELDRHDRPLDLDAAAGLRPGRRDRAAWPARTSSGPSTGRRHGRADRAPRTSTGRSRCSPAAASTPGWPGR